MTPDSAPPTLRAGEASAADTAGVQLERIVVIGGRGRALSLYRMEPEEGASRGSINFMEASRIVLFMVEGEVTRVEADGPIQGYYLDPATGRATPVRPEERRIGGNRAGDAGGDDRGGGAASEAGGAR